MEKQNSDAKIDQLKYLSQSALLEEANDLLLTRKLLVTIAVCMIALLAWAALAFIEEVAIAHGNVVPVQNMQLVQHLEGGIISEIKVQEGELVKQGDILMVLDGSAAENDLDSLKLRRVALEYRVARLRALIKNEKPEFTEMSEDLEANKLAQEQMKAYETALRARYEERAIIQDQIKQKEALIDGLMKKQQIDEKNLALAKEEKEIKENLYKKGHVSKFQYIQVQKQLNNIEGELSENESMIAQAENSLNEYKGRLKFISSKFLDETYEQLNQSETELAQVEETIDKYQDRVDRLEIRAPINGRIKVLNVKTVGGVVESGKVLAEIVPINDKLLVEVEINPKDIGYIEVGQRARVKISTYDYSKYGALKGELIYISASAFQNEKGERYYAGRVALEQNFFGDNRNRNVVIPGMIAQVDIVTGGRSILFYLLNPIYKTVSSSFSER